MLGFKPKRTNLHEKYDHPGRPLAELPGAMLMIFTAYGPPGIQAGMIREVIPSAGGDG